VSELVETPRLWEGERVDPDKLVAQARREFSPVASFCLFSGGNDSGVVAHRMRGHYDALVFIDTGTAVPGVREHVERFAAWLGERLLVYSAPEGAWERLVLDQDRGFPGPPQHNVAYRRLKERAVELLVADHKRRLSSERVLLLTGTRRAESQRRMGFRPPLRRIKSAVWANPITDWTAGDMAAYRRDRQLPESDVAALLHRSGECNCGSFATPGERRMLEQLWPEWFDRTIGQLERRAKAQGIRCWRWGEECAAADGVSEAGPLCSDCQLWLEGVGPDG
jgi:3'-phosphoadenosine 5'-phosphosulfate sulfotransferase (PAPS reductase)/FAD synthetase